MLCSVNAITFIVSGALVTFARILFSKGKVPLTILFKYFTILNQNFKLYIFSETILRFFCEVYVHDLKKKNLWQFKQAIHNKLFDYHFKFDSTLVFIDRLFELVYFPDF